MIGIILWALAAAFGLAFREYAAPDLNTKATRITVSVVLGVVAFVANMVMRLTAPPAPPVMTVRQIQASVKAVASQRLATGVGDKTENQRMRAANWRAIDRERRKLRQIFELDDISQMAAVARWKYGLP